MATVGAETGKSFTAASRPRMAKPPPTLKTAATSGSPEATIERNIKNSSNNASARPIASESASSACLPICPAPPPNSTWSPADRAGWTAAFSESR